MKPPYYVPTMAVVEAARGTNGYTAVSTFSGAGGSCLGHTLAGFAVLWANEFIPAAQDTYMRNHPTSHLDTRDVREVQGADILNAVGKDIGEIDLFDGSPPCSAFSNAGSRGQQWGKIKGYSDTKQRVDDLLFEFARLVAFTRPRVFVAENVGGLLRGKGLGRFRELVKRLPGYTIRAQTMDAVWMGVPQRRERAIIIGVRSDLGVPPAFPKPLKYYYTAGDALPWLRAPAGTRVARLGEITDRVPLAKSRREGKKYNTYEVLPHRPCPTVTVASDGNDLFIIGPTEQEANAGIIAPADPRKINISELRRLCGFPPDFQPTGSFSKQYERLGRAVPPPMMCAVASTIRDAVLRKADHGQQQQH